MGYPLVNIIDSTGFSLTGTVSYASAFCSDDNYKINLPDTSWTAGSRGVCLVKEISADVSTPDGIVSATPYTSSTGTSYSQYAVIRISDNPLQFEVTRRVSAVQQDFVEAGHVEPTSKQKD